MTILAVPNRALTSLTAVAVLAATIVLGVAGPAAAALPTGPATAGLTGARPSATQLRFPISDQVAASVDVATGNLMIATSSLSLPGVTADIRLSLTYNSFGEGIGSTSTPAANKWTFGVDGAGFLSQGATTVIYTNGDGANWIFTPVSGSTTAFSSSPGLKSDLVASGTGYTLTDRTSRQVISFNLDGRPVSIVDRNGNTTTVAYLGATPTSVVSTAGPVAARTATLAYNSGTYTQTVSQTSGSLSRSITYVKNTASELTSIVDAEGKTTSFTYSAGRVSTITAPAGGVTTFTYDPYTFKVLSIAQANTTAGSPGTSITRLAYPTSTQALVAGPNTNQTLSVGTVPHTTYDYNGSTYLVGNVVDAVGRNRAATYTANADVASSTSGAGGTAGTSTAAYGANSGESQTGATTPGGATSSAAYANVAPATKYLASSSTDDAGNGSTYTYNGAGNKLTSTDAMAATATLTYNTDGTVATATAPGNGANKTIYAYNANKQLSTVTPVTGTSLGVRTFTYDDFGRVKTATDGRGITLTYSYDKQDRLLSTAFSDGTTTVTNTYTSAGEPKTRVDANGTTTYSYDQLGRLVSRVNSFAGGTISYGYDKASNLTSTTDTRGTTTNAFDASGIATQIAYTKSGTTQYVELLTDDQGRRTDTWLQSNPTHTVWAAHTHNDYDTSGRVSRTIAQNGPAPTATTTLDISYCYNTATPAPTCSAGAATDRAKLQWSIDNLTGSTTTYTYNASGYVTQVAASAGTGVTATTWAYTYDARGNRLTAVVTGGTTSTQTLTANAGNQVSSAGYSFDGAGNMTADTAGAYAYNGSEQMTTVTQGANVFGYKYAGTSQNEVLEQQKSSSTYKLVYGRTNQQGQPVVEQVKVISGSSTVTAYVENDPVTGQPLLLRTSSGTVALYVFAGVGNPVGLITDSGSQAFAYQFDPYGVPVLTATSGGLGVQQNPYLFAGGIQDRATGWVHFGARWYNPATGRWTQQDTLDNPLDPTNANRYAYVGNDPVNLVDPSGHGVTKACLIQAAEVLGVTIAFLASVANPIALVGNGLLFLAVINGQPTNSAGQFLC